MSGEGVVERAEAPALRQASPLWKWAFVATLTIGGAGTLVVLLVSELNKGEAPAPDIREERKSGLEFAIGDFELPTFAKPEPKREPEPQPAPVVPELPPPETIRDEPMQSVIPPPVPVADAPQSEESPEEIAMKRRLKSALSGGAQGASGSTAKEGAADKAAGSTMDLTATKTETSVATRYRDLTFVVPKGSQIGCILNTAIESGQTGMVSCTLPTDIYGADGTVVLLDRGSQAIGEYKTATMTYGKRRIYVVWSQVRTPEGVVIDIASPGTGPLGRAGMGGHIDNHYWERVGIPTLMSIVSFGSQSYLRDELTGDSSQYIETVPEETLGPALRELARIKPTLHKNQGEPLAIFVARDLDLSSVYELRASDER